MPCGWEAALRLRSHASATTAVSHCFRIVAFGRLNAIRMQKGNNASGYEMHLPLARYLGERGAESSRLGRRRQLAQTKFQQRALYSFP